MNTSVFDTKALVYFYVVAAMGSYRRAAQELGVTPSSLSRPIQQLEHTLGTLLFIRGGRHETQLTPAGQHFLTRVEGMLDVLTEIHGQFKS